MKTTGVSSTPKFGLLDFLGHPIKHFTTDTLLRTKVKKIGMEVNYQ